MSALLIAEALAWLGANQGAMRCYRDSVVMTARDELTMLDTSVRVVGGDYVAATIAAVSNLQDQIATRRERRARLAGGAR